MAVRPLHQSRRRTEPRKRERQARKSALRAALRIHEFLSKPRAKPEMDLPALEWSACIDFIRGIQKTRQRGWTEAGRVLTGRFAHRIEALREQLAELAARLGQASVSRVPPPQQIYEDLLALEVEFEDFEIDLDQTKLSVTTDSIELEGQYLGEFKVVLNWSRIGASNSAFEVIADDPHPPVRDENVTHPHVTDDRLCEGEAKLPIRQALQQGRLFDFFMIVRQVLLTYNPDSAYVRLREWNGTCCADCDGVVLDDEGYACDRCGEFYCGGCSASCARCGYTVCNECNSYREVEHQRFPLQPCTGCEDTYCKECLTDGKCYYCREDGEDQETQEQERPVEETPQDAQGEASCDADASIHSDGVGQVGILA